MFIEFTTQDNKTVLLNRAQIVSIETDNQAVVMGMHGGGITLRIHATEGRVFTLDPRKVSYASLRAQIEPREINNNGQDKSSPI